ncbi:hypothetical protein UFOVP642_31 [uncultured Caudovirales phage]|uniref:Uncharacterized protein n=1 Tax=uncultured Caudovirales phage TaxID=2100421 RepID=A0A6J5N7Q3_9CAUD|nr:hypothetical protein UFOVP642_31 [uncultured Caudovirales phage]
MASVTISAGTIGGSQPNAPTGLTTSTAFDGVQLDWVNPTNTPIDYIQIAASTTNNVAAGFTTVANVKTTAFYDHSTVAGNVYYWVRAVSTLGNIGPWNAGDTAGTVGSPQEVTITTAAIGQIVAYDGTKWVNAPLGLPTGTGGTVTQATSKSTGVTLDKLTGRITMNNSNLASGFSNTFTVTNSTVTSTDSIVTNIVSGAASPGRYMVSASNMTSGSFQINLRNLSGVDLAEAVVVSYLILRGQTT